MVDGFHYLMGGVYCTPCGFASIKGFEDFVRPRFSDLPFDCDPVVERIDSLVCELEKSAGEVDDEGALNLLVAADLRRIQGALRAHSINDPNQSMKANLDRYEVVLRDLGMQFGRPRLFIVDTFPKPYDKMDWTATSPDKADEKDYGITPGNYFKRSHLIPIRSDFLLAHEMTHQIIGEVNPNLLGRGLEEGIAVIFGELFVGAQVLGAELAGLYADYHWHDRRASRGNKLYAQYSRMAATVYQNHGLDGIMAAIRGGRDTIKAVERSYLLGNFDVDLPSGNWIDWYTKVLQKFTTTVMEDLVVSPLSRYIATHAAAGRTVAEIAALANVSPHKVSSSLSELEQDTVTVMLDGDRVAYSDINLLLPGHSLRYEI
ncbi:hypothetical protein ACFWNN_03495 [Lentzea sp. NPDC058450]|uniref:hypothetical protein n=1 Tax=Lentzea sp. NPDC058450 TaxID=3346505 RepID=UPI00364A7BD2